MAPANDGNLAITDPKRTLPALGLQPLALPPPSASTFDLQLRPELQRPLSGKGRHGRRQPDSRLRGHISGSHPGDVVLDPFCGCGTTIDAAEKLGRGWTGIDVTQLAISLIKNRLQDAYGLRMKFVSEPAGK